MPRWHAGRRARAGRARRRPAPPRGRAPPQPRRRAAGSECRPRDVDPSFVLALHLRPTGSKDLLGRGLDVDGDAAPQQLAQLGRQPSLGLAQELLVAAQQQCVKRPVAVGHAQRLGGAVQVGLQLLGQVAVGMAFAIVVLGQLAGLLQPRRAAAQEPGVTPVDHRYAPCGRGLAGQRRQQRPAVEHCAGGHADRQPYREQLLALGSGEQGEAARPGRVVTGLEVRARLVDQRRDLAGPGLGGCEALGVEIQGRPSAFPGGRSSVPKALPGCESPSRGGVRWLP